MSEARGSGFPRRDARGRIDVLPDLLGVVLAGLVIGVLALVLLDWVFALAGFGTFGRANGWLALILPAWLFVEEFRAWGPGPARVLAAATCAALGVALGLLVSGLARDLPPLASGALGAAVAALSYAVTWFSAVRWLARRTS
jgi:hypothetical protein